MNVLIIDRERTPVGLETQEEFFEDFKAYSSRLVSKLDFIFVKDFDGDFIVIKNRINGEVSQKIDETAMMEMVSEYYAT